MSTLTLSNEFISYLHSFNSTSFKLSFRKSNFIYEIINFGEILIGPIYDNWDIKLASAMINAGVSFSPNKLLFGLYNRNSTTLKTHIEEIKDSISITDYRISHDVLDAMYSNNYVRHSDSFTCFYPPAILANITKTNRVGYNEKIFQFYKDLYDNGSIVIRDVLDISAIAALRSHNISFIMPITGGEASKYALHLNSSTQSEQKVACLFPFSDFNDREIGGFLHELTHLSQRYIFDNNAKPYTALNISQSKEYNYAAKQMINNITSLMQINFSPADIENATITTSKFKKDLLDKKDIMLYATRNRLDEPVTLDLLSRIFFESAKGSESTTKYIKALYEAEVKDRNISEAAEVALERFGDWILYQDEELDKESVARFVELDYRFEKLNYSQNSMQSMMTYWQNNISPKVAELKTSLNLLDCTANETMIYEHNNTQYVEGQDIYISNIAATIALVGITYFIGYLAANLPFPHHPMIEHEW